jgi:hypothetical protein
MRAGPHAAGLRPSPVRPWASGVAGGLCRIGQTSVGFWSGPRHLRGELVPALASHDEKEAMYSFVSR